MSYYRNGIEFLKDSKTATVQFCQGRYKSRIRKLAENPDGTLLAHISVEWIWINPGVVLTEEQKQKKVETMLRNRNQTNNNRRETI